MPSWRERVARRGVEHAPVDEQAGALWIAAAHEDVLGHRERRHHVEFLVQEAEAEPVRFGGAADRRADGRRWRSRPYRARRRRPECGSASICRRRSRPSARGFPRLDGEVDPAQRRNAGIGLGDIGEGDETRWTGEPAGGKGPPEAIALLGRVVLGDELGRHVDHVRGGCGAGEQAGDGLGGGGADAGKILRDGGFEVAALGDFLAGLRVGVDTGDDDAFTLSGRRPRWPAGRRAPAGPRRPTPR